jgi:RNA polymerase-binding transcription factor DksA
MICDLEISSARQIATGGTDCCAKCKEDAELKQKLQA